MTKSVRPSVIIFAVGALAFALGYVVFPHDEADHIAIDYTDLELDPGTQAAHFELPGLDGTMFDSKELEGDILVIDFWATWCAPCLTEVPAYNGLHADYRDDGVRMLGITLQSGSAEQVQSWMQQPIRVGTEEFQIEYPIVMGNDHVEATWGPIYGFPLTYLVDSKFRIRKKWLGAVPDKNEQLRVLIDRLIEERRATADD